LARNNDGLKTTAQLDEKGYLVDPLTGLVPHQETDVRRLARLTAPETVDDDELSRALDHLRGGAGSELSAKPGRRPKFLAAYSSSALALNCFAPFLGPRRLDLAGHSVEQPRLETILSIGGGCGRPNLDLLGLSNDHVVAVESKCTEHLKTKMAPTRSDFASLRARDAGDPYELRTKSLAAGDGASELYTLLAHDPLAFRHLDATQLLKHYLGLRSTFESRRCTLLYLYWEPDNAAASSVCREHKAEIARVRPLLNDRSVHFEATTYPTLWRSWLAGDDPFLRLHGAALTERYAVVI
jgi:hypothetical protein